MLRENENHALVPGNPMYGEIMLRYLSDSAQKRFYNDYRAPFWLKPDGSLDMPALMAEFQRFWRENSGDHLWAGITCDGSLDASSNGDGAGIGGGSGISCGNIVIEGGTITATGTPSRRPRLLSAGGFGIISGIERR